MNLHDFIFSNRKSHRLRRHILFWALFTVGFFLQSVVPSPKIISNALFSVVFFLPACVFFFYVSLVILLPAFLKRKKFNGLLLNLILLSFITLLINYIASSVFVINTCDCPSSLIPFSKKLGFAFINTSHAVTVGCLALGIKFLKNWYLRQKENYALTKQRLLKESQLKKANIYPSFLFRSLDKLYQKIISNSTDASTIILTLSDLLSHILYECKDEWVLLEKELLIVSELVNLEKVNEAGKWQIELTTSGSVANKYIPSLLLFSLLQRCLIEMDKGSIEANISKLKIDIYSDELFLIFTMSINMQLNIRSSVWSELLEETYQKLKLLYNNNFQFDYKISNNGLLLSLKMPLYDKVQENLIESDTEQKKIIYESA